MSVPDGEPGKRRYGMWAGQPKGKPEDTSRCIESVRNPNIARGMVSKQCARPRGFGTNGDFCKQHAKRHS
jgi:hypothetical protein